MHSKTIFLPTTKLSMFEIMGKATMISLIMAISLLLDVISLLTHAFLCTLRCSV